MYWYLQLVSSLVYLKVFGVIYKITNLLDGKVYIGQTIRLPHRMRSHFLKSSCLYLRNAIHKYGIENFSYEIIAVAHSAEELDRLEVSAMEYFNSLAPNGYNAIIAGYGDRRNTVFSEETCRKISESNKGKPKHTEERKKEISEFFTNVERTEEWCKNIGQFQKLRAEEKPKEFDKFRYSRKGRTNSTKMKEKRAATLEANGGFVPWNKGMTAEDTEYYYSLPKEERKQFLYEHRLRNGLPLPRKR